jgi:hypothetical protein
MLFLTNNLYNVVPRYLYLGSQRNVYLGTERKGQMFFLRLFLFMLA